MSNIWQTTNQQPWVSALADGLITIKTRIAQPHVPVGATVFLHASKSDVWPHWRGLAWIDGLDLDVRKLPRGVILAVATVKSVGLTADLMKDRERKFWYVDYEKSDGQVIDYDSAAEFAVRFVDVVKLKKPVAVKGMLTPFAHAKDETVKAVIKANPPLRKRLEAAHKTEIERPKREKAVVYVPGRDDERGFGHGCFGY